MTGAFRTLLARYREAAQTNREQGTYFERLVRVWLERDKLQAQQFSRVLTYAEWAREAGVDGRDAGIDLVAQIADSPTDWCAIQCKFYREGHRIQRSDIDSFFTASGRRPFTRRMFVDTTGVPWSEHAEAAMQGQNTECIRVGLAALETCGIDWATFARTGEAILLPRKDLRPDQVEAVHAVVQGLAASDRGKLIMACGTGKTFTGLKIAEAIAGAGGRVLLLVPSLALMSQTVREWTNDSAIPLRSFAVCSDSQVGVRRAGQDDLADINAHDLEIPATTHGGRLAQSAARPAPDRMTVVFSTYQSLQAVADAQIAFGLPEFDLIICDEAHRTTGVTLAGEDESAFVKVHDAAFIRGRKRLYMTATPRVYGDVAQRAAADASATLASMDDEALFGPTLFVRSFGWAVQQGLLTDYKVVVLAVDESQISATLQRALSDADNELVLDDVTRIVGCYRALTKADLKPDVGNDTHPMRRAIAFAKTIKASQIVQREFGTVAAEWRTAMAAEAEATGVTLPPPLDCQLEHVDGTFNAASRGERLAWLKEETAPGVCRILTNARCLSEGVDVPALDAVLFLHPRKSQIDVVQSVGRVMRRAPGKSMGYVILPVGVPAGMPAEEALNQNEKYKVIWQILNALRSHDERLDATINKIDLGVDASDRIEVVAVSNTLPTRTQTERAKADIGAGGGAGGEDDNPYEQRDRQGRRELVQHVQGNLALDEFTRAVLSKIVKKCGTRTYWEEWAKDVARIAEIHITRITAAVARAGSAERAAFEAFLAEIRDDLNESISEADAIEMLAQHLITRPVFEALFESHPFAANNPVSKALQGVLEALEGQNLQKEAQSLERFYASLRTRAAGITDAEARQKIVVELYDKFFRAAFPKLTQKLGIVYTPVEVVDFIIHSVADVLKAEFGQSLADEGVHIIDPFVGTGTFITRLMQSGHIPPERLKAKYASEIHANEIVLLAYYIAAINIEAVFHEITGADYSPFPGICLTDTFQLYEKDDLISGVMADNSTRRARQKSLPIKVIIGNPPYSIGQTSENDNAGNIAYPSLDTRISVTYRAQSSARLSKGLYDNYIRAIRWASDRVKDTGGIVAFVTNGGWIDANTADGMRKCLADEFTTIDVFHLRGNQRTQGEQSRREGGKIFGGGSRAPVAITVLALNPANPARGRIRFHDIGDYLSREEKLARISRLRSLAGLEAEGLLRTLTPDAHGDWLNQRDDSFSAFMPMGDKDGTEPAIFTVFSQGVLTSRDAWCVNPSRKGLLQNVHALVAAYESERARLKATGTNLTAMDADTRAAFIDRFVTDDPTRISWSRALKADLSRDKPLAFDPTRAVRSAYRPFSPQWLYFDRRLNEMVYQMPRIAPSMELDNTMICVSNIGAKFDFSAMQAKAVTDFQTMFNGQNFPRYHYTPTGSDNARAPDLFDADGAGWVRHDAITDVGLAHFRAAYPGEAISKDDLFDYVYGLLHAPDYRARYADNLTKELPRIPRVRRVDDFRAFAAAGQKLGRLHADYDTVDPWPVTIREGDLRLANIDDPVAYWRVENMKFAGTRPNQDKTTILYNPRVTITNVPLEAYDYVVNGKSAIDWVMERQCVKTDPKSGIVSDANAWAVETLGNPRYPFDLLCRVITVSMETLKIVRSLPALDIHPLDVKAGT